MFKYIPQGFETYNLFLMPFFLKGSNISHRDLKLLSKSAWVLQAAMFKYIPQGFETAIMCESGWNNVKFKYIPQGFETKI